jgi:hypothetical protein
MEGERDQEQELLVVADLTATRVALVEMQAELETLGTWQELSDGFDMIHSRAIEAVRREILSPPPARDVRASPELLGGLDWMKPARFSFSSAGPMRRAWLPDCVSGSGNFQTSRERPDGLG